MNILPYNLKHKLPQRKSVKRECRFCGREAVDSKMDAMFAAQSYYCRKHYTMLAISKISMIGALPVSFVMALPSIYVAYTYQHDPTWTTIAVIGVMLIPVLFIIECITIEPIISKLDRIAYDKESK